MGLTTSVSAAKSGTRSLKTTIPEGIVSFLDLKPGEKVDWTMEFIKGRRVAAIAKSANSSKK